MIKIGQKVTVINMKSYDALSKENVKTGLVYFIWPDGRIAVEIDGGQTNADPKDVYPII